MLLRLIEARFAGVRRLATDVVDGLDDRSKLFVLELAAEQQRLTRLAVISLGALIVTALAVVWAAATLVAFTWDTEWRHTTLLALLVFWSCAPWHSASRRGTSSRPATAPFDSAARWQPMTSVTCGRF